VGLREGDELTSKLDSILVFTFTILILTVLIGALTWKKFKRKRDNRKRWQDIKELEKDYDIYVSDEYAYQVNELQMQMEFIQNFRKFSKEGGDPGRTPSVMLGQNKMSPLAQRAQRQQTKHVDRPNSLTVSGGAYLRKKSDE